MLNISPAGDQVMFRVWVKNEVDVPCFHWFFYLALFYLALKRDLDSFLESKFIKELLLSCTLQTRQMQPACKAPAAQTVPQEGWMHKMCLC